MLESSLKLGEISKENFEVYSNLSQAYEAEVSRLTRKMPDELGNFPPDTVPAAPYIGHILYWKKFPVGFFVSAVESAIKDIAEFYIVPVMSKKKLGYQLGLMMTRKYPGEWQAKQIEGAVDAISFCRSSIRKYTLGKYEESIVWHQKWGYVTRQCFNANKN